MTEADRPNPDELLAAVNRDEARRRRGRLRIFFGAAAGVGKTYSMLEAAQQARRAGVPKPTLHGRFRRLRELAEKRG